jgi:hypothetical protein
MTLETVGVDTPASAATSARFSLALGVFAGIPATFSKNFGS